MANVRVGILLFPRLTQLDATGPYEIFSRLRGAEVHLVAASSDPVASEHGMRITPTTTMDAAPALDVVCVPGGPGIGPLLNDEHAHRFLTMQARTARWMTSVCTGSLVLGAAGLLRGYRATTHWLSMDLLPIFGAEPVEARVVVDRDRITGGGVTAGLDFALSVAAELAGEAEARRIQLLLEYDPAPPFASGSPRSADPALVAAIRVDRAESQAERRRLAEKAAARFK